MKKVILDKRYCYESIIDVEEDICWELNKLEEELGSYYEGDIRVLVTFEKDG